MRSWVLPYGFSHCPQTTGFSARKVIERGVARTSPRHIKEITVLSSGFFQEKPHTFRMLGVF
jgi:hypothetical protein